MLRDSILMVPNSKNCACCDMFEDFVSICFGEMQKKPRQLFRNHRTHIQSLYCAYDVLFSTIGFLNLVFAILLS